MCLRSRCTKIGIPRAASPARNHGARNPSIFPPVSTKDTHAKPYRAADRSAKAGIPILPLVSEFEAVLCESAASRDILRQHTLEQLRSFVAIQGPLESQALQLRTKLLWVENMKQNDIVSAETQRLQSPHDRLWVFVKSEITITIPRRCSNA